MRVEPHSIGSVMHIVKRGARGMEIVRDNADRYDFVRSLFLLNDTHQDNDWRRYVSGKPLFYRPESWPERNTLVSPLAWTLLDNHFHLLVQERLEGGIAKFMQRLCGSMSRRFNEKYGERGSIFQGGYKGRLVDTDIYLQYVHSYIVVKNTYEMLSGGLKKNLSNFSTAWDKALKYPFTSLKTAAEGAESPILAISAMRDLGLIRKDFKQYAKSMLFAHADTKEEYTRLILEDWV